MGLLNFFARKAEEKVEEVALKSYVRMKVDNKFDEFREKSATNGICDLNGARLRQLRVAAHLSQEELGDRILCTESIIRSWEEGWGIIRPSSGEIEMMAEIFQMSEEQLRLELNAPEEYDYDYNDDDDDDDW